MDHTLLKHRTGHLSILKHCRYLCNVIHSGEFWMEFFTDFCREFEEVSICTLGPDFNHDGAVDEAKSVKVVLGEWVKDLTSGGCRNDMTKFSTNPQFLLEIPDPSTSTNVSNVKSQVVVMLPDYIHST